MRPHLPGSAPLLVATALLCSCAPAPSPDEGQGAPNRPELRALLLHPEDPAWSEPAPDDFRVVITSDVGPFVIELYREWAPIGVDRFYQLVRHGFYDDSRFYRVRAGYIAQFGIAGDPVVANAWRDQTIADDPVVGSNTYGTLGYAMTGPDTRTTQLYINLADNTHLDAEGFAPIGRIVAGMEGVVQRLYAEYGEDAGGGMRAGQQGRIFAEGNVHLDEEYPLLSRLIEARLLTE